MQQKDPNDQKQVNKIIATMIGGTATLAVIVAAIWIQCWRIAR